MTIGHEEFSKEEEGEEESSSGVGATPLEERRRDRERSLSSLLQIHDAQTWALLRPHFDHLPNHRNTLSSIGSLHCKLDSNGSLKACLEALSVRRLMLRMTEVLKRDGVLKSFLSEWIFPPIVLHKKRI